MVRLSIPQAYGGISLALLVLLSGCATGPTPYQPAEGRHGYTSQDLGERTVLVSFRGNAQTSEKQVEDALFRRMVEIADSRGAGHFTIVEEHTDCVTTLQTSPITTCTYRQSADAMFPYNFGVYEIESPWHASPRREFEASATIYRSPSTDCGDAGNCHVTSEAVERIAGEKS